MWTLRRKRPNPITPDAEEWVVAYAGRNFGSVWQTRDQWFWVTWTLPREAGQAATLQAAAQAARAAALRTDGIINRFDSLSGPDFPDERKRRFLG